uniref:Indole-3-acetic acid-amido synthetase GH3.17-like n=1 Tax=Kalanchoe fedtschenkoi TaxID=63787 RepID=A0A7N0RAB4_KALFE
METLLPRYDPNDDKAGLELWDAITSNAGEIQQQVLSEILKQNNKTEYLTRFLHGEASGEDFRKNVPIVGYNDIKSYIERVCHGEPSHIISAQTITELLTSSGTSGGKPKMMPSTAEELERKTLFYNLLVPVINKYVGGLDQGKGMYLLFVKPEITTPGGLMARPVLTSYYKSQNFRSRPFNKYNVYTSPDDTILCSDSKQSMFAQLVCGLVERHEVLRVGAVFASALLRAIKFLESHWQELCSNIRTGHVSDWITDEACRNAVSLVLGGPNPELADLIESQCNKESWEGIIKLLWPKTKFIEVIVTGSMAQYIPTLEFYSGGLPLISTMYASSECYFGINLNPLCKPSQVSYTLLPNMAYFEFLPVTKNGDDAASIQDDVTGNNGSSQNSHDDRKPVALVDVKPGHYYELVVTTFTGLYRYRVEDILLVTGFHKNAPQFRFIHRKNVALSIDTDKTSEDDLLNAVTQAKLVIEPLGLLLTEYTSYADTCTIPGHYALFWELTIKGNNNSDNNIKQLPEMEDDIMVKCCHAVEEALDSVYRRCRYKDKSIGALEIRVVSPGTFDALMDHFVSLGSSVNQYKTPRCVTSEGAIRLLDERVVGRFFSQRAPFWEPCRMEKLN